MKKKIFVLILSAVLMVGLFAGCGKAKEEAPIGMPNPFVEVSAEELAQVTGLVLTPPAGAEDIRFSYLNSDSVYKMAQMDFTYNGKRYTYRAEPTGELEAYDMSGLYYNWTDVRDVSVLYNEAKLQLSDKAGSIYWLDIVPGINYSLGSNEPVSAEELTELANLIYVPTQGDAYGDDEIFPSDYSGTYRDGNENEVVMVKNGSSYDVQIGIYRLTKFEGNGNIEDGAVYIIAKDPNGNDMVAVFFPAGDGSFTLRVAQSEWELLEEGTEFAGFYPAG